VKITVEMEPRELHEVLMLAAATMGPDLPEPPTPVKATRPKAITAKKVNSERQQRSRKAAQTYLSSLPAPTKVIRQWARENGLHPAKGGMLAPDIIEAYKEAM
jgi:hypothetical protein